MSGWYPKAIRRELPYAKDMPARRQAKTLCVHTNGGGTDHGSLYGWFARKGNNVASHFQVMRDGTVEQYIPIDKQAYAQVRGNDHCVSAECEDAGDPNNRLTTAQLHSLVGICQWLDVPANVGTETGDGVVWHELFPSYNPHGHVCPGRVREKQIRDELIPMLGDDMPLSDADVQKILDAPIGPIDNDPHKVNHTVRSLLRAVGHEVYAIRSISTQDLDLDKKQK